MPENLHQQPGRVTAGPRAFFKGLLACLDARVQPGRIVDFVSHLPIQVNQKADRSQLLAAKFDKESLEQRAGWLDRTIRFKIPGLFRSVLATGRSISWLPYQ